MPTKSLCIEPAKAVWVLYVDATCINYDGNAFDATLLAMVAALKNSPCLTSLYPGPGVEHLTAARLPQATFNAETNRTVCSRKTKTPLHVGRLPVAMSFGVFDGYVPFMRGRAALMLMQDAHSRRPDVVRGTAARYDVVRGGRRERWPRVCQPARAWGSRQPGRTTAMHICCSLSLSRAHGAIGKYLITLSRFTYRSPQRATAFARADWQPDR